MAAIRLFMRVPMEMKLRTNGKLKSHFLRHIDLERRQAGDPEESPDLIRSVGKDFEFEDGSQPTPEILSGFKLHAAVVAAFEAIIGDHSGERRHA